METLEGEDILKEEEFGLVLVVEERLDWVYCEIKEIEQVRENRMI